MGKAMVVLNLYKPPHPTSTMGLSASCSWGVVCGRGGYGVEDGAVVENAPDPPLPPSPTPSVWDRPALEECLERVLAQQGRAFCMLSRPHHRVRVFGVDHTHGAAQVFTYFYVSGKEGKPGARFKVVCANDRGGGRHRVKINPHFSRAKCAKVMGKFVAYCIAKVWRG